MAPEEEYRKKTINEIASHIGIELDPKNINEISEDVFSKKSPTFRSGKTKGWQKNYSEKQKDLLKDRIGDWLIKYGYEENFNW